MFKMKNLLFLIFIFNFSYSQKNKEKLNFDSIDYYRLIEEENNISKEVETLLDGKTYNNFNDSYLENLLNKKEFVNFKLSLKDVNYIKNKIFVDSKCDFESAGNCISVYRDFLVLKEKARIILVAYVCLNCSEVVFYNENGLYFFKCFNENEKNNLLVNILKKYNLE